jgi:hypothetical protein
MTVEVEVFPVPKFNDEQSERIESDDMLRSDKPRRRAIVTFALAPRQAWQRRCHPPLLSNAMMTPHRTRIVTTRGDRERREKGGMVGGVAESQKRLCSL